MQLESTYVGKYFDICCQCSTVLLAKEKSIIQSGLEPKISIIQILEHYFSLNNTYGSKLVTVRFTLINIPLHFISTYCYILSQLHEKKQSGYTGRFCRIFGICQQQRGGHLLRGQIFFEELQAVNSIEGILTFLDNNMLIVIAIVD